MRFVFLIVISTFVTTAFGQTIQEKKESFKKSAESGMDAKLEEELILVNEMLSEKRFYLKALHERAQSLYYAHAEESRYKKLLEEVEKTKKELLEIEESWRDRSALISSGNGYALWHQPETTLGQLVMDYGKGEYLYIIPKDIENIKICLNSNLPIPKESWEACLEMILAQNGVGIKALNSYVRELYLFRFDLSHIQHITSSVVDLSILPAEVRICFVITPESPDPTSALHFLQRFASPATTVIEKIRQDIYLIADVKTIRELLKLYDFFKIGKKGEEYQLVTLGKIDSKTMLNILQSAFYAKDGVKEEQLKILPLENMQQALFLFGSKAELNKAIALIRDVEYQIEDPKEKVVFWYTAKHSDAEELATLLAQVYDLLVKEPVDLNGEAPFLPPVNTHASASVTTVQEEVMVVDPPLITPATGRMGYKTRDGQNNFIVDPKTSSIIMVVEQEALIKIKELLKKLDVPKKMVQIEVLLFEKKISNHNKFGLNLLRLGEKASNRDGIGAGWNSAAGILEFLVSHAAKGSGIPAYDIAYNFLLGQEDIQINASPSVVTTNKTPATIAIVEEISINTGVDSEDKKQRNLYSRAQYGITLQITPTINLGEDECDSGFITLDTDITFDTTSRKDNDRPDVTRRHIKNLVRIADGQTVILGGLRRKSTEDSKNSIPFLGEIPGLGKFFSSTDLNDSSSEMFIFITPKIISDPLTDMEIVKKEMLKQRPGDIPEFLTECQLAKEKEKKRLCLGGLTALFGREEKTTSTTPRKEYDGK